jgi:ABC-type branched-subunit amino acid transport system substrate-binding protein
MLHRSWDGLWHNTGCARLALLACCLLLLCSCALPGSVKPTVKIGLSAPFEGLDRDLGYEALYAVRLAVQQRNDTGGVGGRFLVELVALNDFNEPEEAIGQAREMAVDSDVLAVLGGWSPETALAAAPEYQRLGLAFLTPETDGPQSDVGAQNVADVEFAAAYQAMSGGAPPGSIARWAYAATNHLLDVLDAAVQAGGRSDRTDMLALWSISP